MRTEWTEKLKELLGENRGELLDELVRTPISPAFYLQKHRRFLPESNDDVNWLRRGTETIEIEIDPDTRSVRFQSQVKDGNHGSFGPFNPDRVPKRWQHLLTRDLVIWP